MYDNSCIFCKIAQKKAPASTIYEDEDVMAFLDIRPLAQGHTLIIPKKHYKDIFDTPPELLAKIHKTTQQTAIAVQKATHADGISIFQQNGAAAGQEIFHIHVHVVPRHEGQKLSHFGNTEANRQELDQTAAEIKRQFTQ
ncbi:MAG: HIT family protein [Candidatus Bathyarchaeota archaeon]|nr:HIT family protein [Candidatus Bathyarchaeota archaeon]